MVLGVDRRDRRRLHHVDERDLLLVFLVGQHESVHTGLGLRDLGGEAGLHLLETDLELLVPAFGSIVRVSKSRHNAVPPTSLIKREVDVVEVAEDFVLAVLLQRGGAGLVQQCRVFR